MPGMRGLKEITAEGLFDISKGPWKVRVIAKVDEMREQLKVVVRQQASQFPVPKGAMKIFWEMFDIVEYRMIRVGPTKMQAIISKKTGKVKARAGGFEQFFTKKEEERLEELTSKLFKMVAKKRPVPKRKK